MYEKLKKKIIPLLSMLLFIYLFALCGTSYAVVLDNSIVKEYCYIMGEKLNNSMATLVNSVINSTEFEQARARFFKYR